MKKTVKRLTALILAMLLALSMIGCNNGGEDGTTAGNKVEDGKTVYPYEIDSADGRKVTLEAEPEKVVSISPTLTEALYDLEAGDKLVGRSDYCTYPEEVSQVESIGTIQTPDIEKIISLDPDLVLASGIVAEDMIQKLADVDIAVMVVEEAADLEAVYTMLTTLGAVLNRNTEAAARVDEMKTTISEVEEKIAGLEAPTTYYVVAYGEYGDSTAGGDTFIHDILTTAGGDNIAKDISGWAINLEEIIEADPDIIILPKWYDGAFQTAENYKDLTAVKEDRVYVVDSDMIDRQGYRNAEAIRVLAEIYHPEAFK